ncbi:MAG: hypothetical protein CMG04_01075 [Candidatus Marinimicrobia bacterium]|nr:hypothetical protein [Candidatus Neomarinimicrobiota bacterium]
MKSQIYFYMFTFIFIGTPLFSQNIDSSFSVKWKTLPWGSGGLYPAGPPWSMVGPYDFDNDGYGDFIVSSSYTGSFCNDVYHYEAVEDDSISLQWFYTFSQLSCSYDNYSSVTVGDIDGDNNLEILALMDTEPGVSGQDGFYVFEWDPNSLSFPDTATASWNMGLDSVWEAAQILTAELDGDENQEIIISVMGGPWGTTGSSTFMIFELENSDLNNPSWNIEYEDPVTTNWSGYNISVGDLDQDGRMEIYTIAYEYYRLIIYENLGSPDLYEYQTSFYSSLEVNERGNQSIIITDINNDNNNELFAATSGTNTLTGTLLTPGYFFVVEGIDDVSQLTFESFTYLSEYSGGIRQIIQGDADNDGKPNLYLAGHYDEALYDWEYNGGAITTTDNYNISTVFMDDTTDAFTPNNDQGKVRVAKIFSGDIDSDGMGDLIITSGSFAVDKPQLFMIEHNGFLSNEDHKKLMPSSVHLQQNFPNPFNPETQISYALSEPSFVTIDIFDILGRQVYDFSLGYQKEGNHNVLWTGINTEGKNVPNGVYFYQLNTGKTIKTKKMILSR